MYVCVCNAVTERQVRELVDSGCTSVAELRMRTGLGADCGSCLKSAVRLLRGAQADQPSPSSAKVVPLPLLSNVA